MAFLHCTGPVLIWVRVGGPGVQPAFLGTCEQNPLMDCEPAWEPVMNDIAGSMIQFDKMYMGAVETVIMDLNRFNEGVFSTIESQPNFLGFPGINNNLDRGSFLIQPIGGRVNGPGVGFEMWLQYSFFGTANAAPDLLRGWYYPACAMAGVYTPKQGLKIQSRRLVVEANPVYTLGDGKWSFVYKLSNATVFAPINKANQN